MSNLDKITNLYKNLKISSLKSENKDNEKLKEMTFQDILSKQISLDEENCEIKFSNHAQSRMEARNINLDNVDISRIENGIKKAESKGARDTLIIKDDVALLVNIKNKTVVTAVNKEQLKENVFTNIDSAVIV